MEIDDLGIPPFLDTTLDTVLRKLMINHDQSIYDPLYSWQTYDATMYGYPYTHHNAIQKVSWFDWLWLYSIIITITIWLFNIAMENHNF